MSDLPDGMIEDRITKLQADTGLSAREAEAMAYKSFGIAAPDIADEMGIERSTVDEYVKRARAKAKSGFVTFKVLEDLSLVEEPPRYE